MRWPAADAGEVITVQFVALLQSLKERIHVLEQHIAQAMAARTDAKVFTSLPRSGTVRAATLLAEIGHTRGRSPPTTLSPPPLEYHPRPALPDAPDPSSSATAATDACAKP